MFVFREKIYALYWTRQSFAKRWCGQRCAHTVCTHTALNVRSTQFDPILRRQVHQLSGLTVARQSYLSHDTAFIRPYVPVLKI